MAELLGAVEFQGYTIRDLKTGRYVKKADVGKLLKNRMEEISNKTSLLHSKTLDAMFGTDKFGKSANESGNIFIEHGLTDTEKALGKAAKKGFAKKCLKWGAAGLLLSGLFLGGKYLYDKFTKKEGKPEPNVAPPQNNSDIKPDPAADKPAVDEPVINEEPSSSYTVKKGDNLWNIAKQMLVDEHKDTEGYKPTNAEILERTEELMKLNDKEYLKPLPKDSRKRKVALKPGEEIKLR
jgi:LysM repeat protein